MWSDFISAREKSGFEFMTNRKIRGVTEVPESGVIEVQWEYLWKNRV